MNISKTLYITQKKYSENTLNHPIEIFQKTILREFEKERKKLASSGKITPRIKPDNTEISETHCTRVNNRKKKKFTHSKKSNIIKYLKNHKPLV